ncbi:MAG: hypothetical protein D3916_17640 [Candidatus Electrothrix sp. MAN1_4]|nr:hypothetical protein [Candidatus Electrothrix sp. MAN1_4]
MYKEFFDEIVVLQDEQVTEQNLKYFLQGYFPDRLKAFPKSRFLFAYSGHGITLNKNGYLLQSTAQDLEDRLHSIKTETLRSYVEEVVQAGHHVLVILNSCYSGSFLRSSYGNASLIPQNPGAHAITAGGSGEKAWHDGKLGTGSVFYEKLFVGLRGKADEKPYGIITSHELGTYLINEIRLFSEQRQNPQMGDLIRDGSTGEFFFINEPLRAGEDDQMRLSDGTVMGNDARKKRQELAKEIKSKVNRAAQLKNPFEKKNVLEYIYTWMYLRINGIAHLEKKSIL